MFTDTSVVVGIDLGGTATRFVSMNADGDVVARLRVPTPPSLGEDQQSVFFATHIVSLVGSGILRGVGIGASGPIDGDGVIRNPDTLPAFSNINLTNKLRDLLGVPCMIDNDAVAAALAEYRHGSQRGASSLLLVTLGTGVGTCLLLNGRPFRGSDGWHPEGGHLGVAGAAPCYCGRVSCWEQIASRAALQAAVGRVDPEGIDDEAATDRCAARARAGHLESMRVFDTFGHDVGEGLATLLGLYRPQAVIIGGSGAKYFSVFAHAMVQMLDLTQLWHASYSVSATVLDDFGGAMGAAGLFDMPSS